MKLFDKLFINGVVIASLSILFFYVTKVFIAGLFIGYLVWIVSRTLFLYASNRFRTTKNLSVKEMENVFAVWGTAKQAEHFFRLFPSSYHPELVGNKIKLIRNDTPITIVFNYKFSPTSCEDVAGIYRESRKENEKIYCFGKSPSKEVFLLTNTLSLPIEFCSSRKVRKYLIKNNAMPEKIYLILERKNPYPG